MTTIGGIPESRLISTIRGYLSEDAGLDDAAVWRNGPGLSVLSTDMSVEGIHFDLAWMSARDAGWRALALALGDIAAKGADPSWALISLGLPRGWLWDDFEGLYEGMHALAQKTGLVLIGGDLSATDGPAVLSIAVAGEASQPPVPRGAVRPDWVVAVTGPLGAAAIALRERRVLLLEPRLAEGKRLNAMGLCCGDISDGLVREMEKFKNMAGPGSVIRAIDVPVADGATWRDALVSGEEAELVCVGPEDLVRKAGLVPIGVMTRFRAVVVEGPDGVPVTEDLRGYDHFA
jgi:thiamine-monophosphate kinase